MSRIVRNSDWRNWKKRVMRLQEKLSATFRMLRVMKTSLNLAVERKAKKIGVHPKTRNFVINRSAG